MPVPEASGSYIRSADRPQTERCFCRKIVRQYAGPRQQVEPGEFKVRRLPHPSGYCCAGETNNACKTAYHPTFTVNTNQALRRGHAKPWPRPRWATSRNSRTRPVNRPALRNRTWVELLGKRRTRLPASAPWPTRFAIRVPSCRLGDEVIADRMPTHHADAGARRQCRPSWSPHGVGTAQLAVFNRRQVEGRRCAIPTAATAAASRQEKLVFDREHVRNADSATAVAASPTMPGRWPDRPPAGLSACHMDGALLCNASGPQRHAVKPAD